MSKADELLVEYDEVTKTYFDLPEEEQDGKNHEHYEDALLRLVHGMADELRPGPAHLGSTPKVSADTAGMVLYHLDPTHPASREPGGFTTNLLKAWDRADSSNAAKLATVFPEIAACISVANHSGGVETLAILAKNGR